MIKYMRFALVLIAILVLAITCTDKEEGVPYGSIAGVVTDKATSEPIKAAGVSVGAISVVTGNDGYYEFHNIDNGSYRIQVQKTGYDLFSSPSEVTVYGGETTQYDIQLQKLPPSLRVVDSNTSEDITSIDLGLELNSASFNVFNDGVESLEWQIAIDDEWVVSINKESGTLKPGATQPIVMKINRLLLKTGENTTTIHVTSDNGSKNIILKASNDYELPTLNTLEAQDVTTTTAIAKGKLLTLGRPQYKERGFVYSISSMPTVDNTIAKVTVAVTDENEYSAKLTGLTKDETYYVRAYAINDIGTAYSTNETKFSTNATAPIVKTDSYTNKVIATSSVTLNGTIEEEGDPKYTEKGFVYGGVHNPTVEDDTKKVASGTGEGAFSVNLTTLEINKVYYVRAYAINETGTSYGEEIEVDMSVVSPVVATLECTNKSVTTLSVTLRGQITGEGDPVYTERGFVYGRVHNPTIEDDTKKIAEGRGIGEFYTNLTDLEANTVYYIRAYASNEFVTAYGNEIEIDMAIESPEISTSEVIPPTGDSNVYTFKGQISNTGDPSYIESGFLYGEMQLPTFENEAIVVRCSSLTPDHAEVSDLIPGTIYYVRFYVKTLYDTYYSENVIRVEAQHELYYVIKSANLMIVKKPSESWCSYTSAKLACESISIGGFLDWRLPTKEELALVYNSNSKIGLPLKTYWSSSLSRSVWGSYGYLYYYYRMNFGTGDLDEGEDIGANSSSSILLHAYYIAVRTITTE